VFGGVVMTREDQLREMMAKTLMTPPDGVNAGTSLAILDNSLGEAKLRLGLKRLGLKLSPGVRPASFGDLCELLSGKEPQPIRPAPQNGLPSVPNSALDGLSVGLDVQEVSSLPLVTDYWEDAFYLATFAKPEIAYAVMKPEPRIHFAGFWCAKEALRKCDASFGGVEPVATVVAHEAGGRPFLVWNGPTGEIRLRHALSISHSGAIAMAIVVNHGRR
jgi:phosphopantetheinyl transferase (holo-ACP synthase)